MYIEGDNQRIGLIV